MTTSSFVRIADTVPALAVKPLWKTTTASTFLNSASRRSSSMWISIVPAIVRTDPVPTPNFSIASSAALAQPRMRRQTEIVVRRQVDDRTVVEGGVRLLLVVENAQVAVEVLFFQGIELFAQVGKRICAHPGEYSPAVRHPLAGRRRPRVGTGDGHALSSGLPDGAGAETADCAKRERCTVSTRE